MKKYLLLLILVSITWGQDMKIKLPAIISDNMVLQQKKLVPIWGEAQPGSTIKITSDWNESVSAMCSEKGEWKAEIKTPEAGGPYAIKISDGNSVIELKNILIGEVWLCSGQSNMEMPLMGWPPNDLIMGSEEEIKNADYPQIRLFTVTRNAAIAPVKDCIGQWSECSPTTAASFSATAFFFGKKLYRELNIPIGLIHSSWGGTPAEAWTDREHIETMEEFVSIINAMDESVPALAKLNKWLTDFPQLDITEIKSENPMANLDFYDDECKKKDFNDSEWLNMKLPTLWEMTEVKEFDGVIWFRKKVELPESWTGKELQISLGPIDDFDRTYVNGELVGSIEIDGNYQTIRVYEIGKSINDSKEMMISVRVNDTRGGGGIYGSPEKMFLTLKETGEKISIAGEWKYLPVAEFRNNVYFLFGAKNEIYRNRPIVPVEIGSNTPTALYNGMIAPLLPYSINGAIWYQGESNAGKPEQYEILFPLMINNWREKWGNDFPFYFVQIAPYNYGPDTPSEFLRDSQRKSLQLKNTGMAVTLDISKNSTIHPPDKKNVGERLALWALAKQFGKKIVYSGPLFKSSEIADNKIVLSFDYVGSGLELKTNGDETEFLIAGEDKVFHKAEVKIDGEKIIVWSENVPNPAAVRYSWSNTSGATLFNKEGLPASSFRTDNWKR